MPEVFDISSDEEEGLKEETKSSDLDWIQELLFNSDDESDADSDVVIIHENKPPELKSKSSKDAVDDDDDEDGDDDDDDDCVVLEGDPENGVTSVDEKDSTGSDELVVVGEKGQGVLSPEVSIRHKMVRHTPLLRLASQLILAGCEITTRQVRFAEEMFKKVACRDYPHARHLCAKFPFSSTPHEIHCGQCHCFVCDSLAPCIKWGTGISSSDHCHAHDKTEVWKIQRKDFKRTLSSPLPAPTNYDTSLGVVRSQSNENLPCDITHLSPISVLRNQAARSTAMHIPSLNCIPPNQVSRPKATYAHFSLSSGMQNQISRPINAPVSKATSPTIPNGANRGRYLESRSNLVRDRNRSHYAPKQLLGVRNHAIQRERGRGSSSLGPQLLRSPMLSKELAGCTGYILGANHPFRNSPTFKNHVNSVQIHSATGFSKPLNVSILSHSSSAPVSPSCVIPHTVTPETQYGQALSQSNHSQNFHQTWMQGNNAPYAACLNNNQHGNELQTKSQNGNITQSGITNQDTCQPKPQEESQNITAGRFSSFDPSWAENTSQLNPLFEHSPLQSTGSTDQPPNMEKFSTQFTESVEPASGSSHIPSTIVDFENWLSGKETGPMATDGVLPFENIPSPDPSLFDVDTSELSSLWW